MCPRETRRECSSETLPAGEILHHRAETELPMFALVARTHAIGQLAKLRCCDRDDIAALVSEPFALHIPVLDRGKHGAEKKRKSVGILVRGSDRLRDQVLRIPADLADRGMPLENKAVLADDGHRNIHPAHVIETE